MRRNAWLIVAAVGLRAESVERVVLMAAEPPAQRAIDQFPMKTAPDSAEPQLILGDCPGSESCCTTHGSPGCDNITCCENVCISEPFCCFALWDADCVFFAQLLCGSLCAGACPGDGDCCATHTDGGCDDFNCCDQVCNSMPSCCESDWSDDCAELAVQICEVCEPPYVCPQPGDCCTERFFTAGCERAGCCETVCGTLGDEICCTGAWDDICASEARDHCLNVCDCKQFGNFDVSPIIDLRDTAGLFNCFSGDGSPPVPSACACADYEGDGDADWADFSVFKNLLAP